MKQYTYPTLGETVYRHTLPNGLPIAVVPKKGFTRKQAYFVTDFGSIHTQFTMDGKEYRIPDGVAHFLEHKLFDMPGRDITEDFSALGASPNAFTGYDMTAYYFSCTDHFPQCLELLLEFVSQPYFTQETVDKEQGIIAQEIIMNEDSPDTRIFENLMQAMYREHPGKQPILGTRESISTITPQILRDTHRAFYRPDNMFLCVVGDVDPEEVCRIAERILPREPGPQVTAPRQWPEDLSCIRSEVYDKMEVAMPTLQLGFKCQPLGKGPEAIRQEFIGDLAADILFSDTSPLYLRMYEEGLIDASFGGGLETVEGMCMLSASGDCDEPLKVRQAIWDYAANLEQIDDETLLRLKRSAMGRRLRALDSFDSTCFRLCAYHFSDFDYFQFPAIYEAITPQEVLSYIRENVIPERCCLSVIEPIH